MTIESQDRESLKKLVNMSKVHNNELAKIEKAQEALMDAAKKIVEQMGITEKEESKLVKLLNKKYNKKFTTEVLLEIINEND